MTQPDILSINEEKITRYLLDPLHPQGASKAKFFLMRGFDPARPKELADQLADVAISGWPGGGELQTVGAVKHRIVGNIRCPNGSTANVLPVWQVDDGSKIAAFVTAIPRRFKVVSG